MHGVMRVQGEEQMAWDRAVRRGCQQSDKKEWAERQKTTASDPEWGEEEKTSKEGIPPPSDTEESFRKSLEKCPFR